MGKAGKANSKGSLGLLYREEEKMLRTTAGLGRLAEHKGIHSTGMHKRLNARAEMLQTHKKAQ